MPMLSKDKIKKSVYAFVSSPVIRLYVSIFTGLVINIVYIGGNIHSAVIQKSFWSGAVTVYYLLFIVLRLYLLWSGGRSDYAVKRSCRTVGVLLLVLTAIAGVIIAYSVLNEKIVKYSGYVLIVFFVYAIYSLTISLLGMKRWLNDNKPLHFAARSVTFSAALMSAFNLQYSLLTSLGLSDATVKCANGIGGIVTFSIIATLGIAIVLKSKAELGN